MTEFSIPVRVYIEDTDAGGIVYYVNYLKFMERARTEFMRSLGYGKTAIFDDDAMFVVHSCSVNYLSSAVLDDELLVSADILKTGKTYIVFDQQVKRAGEIICKAEVKIACINRQNHSPVAMPKDMINKLESTA